MLKFGRLAMADALSGTSGQVIPERDPAVIALLTVATAGEPGEPSEPGEPLIERDPLGSSLGDPPAAEPGGAA
jgi:hypothetical protein